MTRLDRLRDVALEARVGALQDIIATPSQVTAEELDAVIDALGDPRKAVQRRAAEALARCAPLSPAMMNRLRALTTAAEWSQRWGSVFALSLLGALPATVTPTLLDAFDRDDGDVRWAAADLLKRLAAHEPSAVGAVLLRSTSAGSVNQRKMALYCLRDLRLAEGSDAAETALRDDAVEVRLAALAALATLARHNERAAQSVGMLMADADIRVRRAAAVALGHLGVASIEVCAALRDAMGQDDPSLQRAAARALRQLEAASPVSDSGNRGG